MTTKEFLILLDVSCSTDEIYNQLNRLKKPFSICGVITPETLNDITMGELIELQSISQTLEFAFMPSKILLKLSDEQIQNTNADKILGFSMWVAKEVERINKLFNSTNTKPTKNEIEAGIDELKFGMFGLIDYYALRMGITNHEDIESIPWVRVYKCLDMDAKKIKFQRKLQTISSL